ncbi:uncharacterized protein SCHCODRAFT_02615623 [Schizophyllum commune H4-8]|uniref:uncharacterized protein n=1 Tax=Schizophyllum commune (strain H4-8 / FGSC 9210) TaxID=578458 RepID=UPI00216015E1|nr:uncharacterized protein SCHCODRAFT_02615623 [Schizophyllum commune H4-8]KAI5896712.1 hypothetical protein SCHCODRAFT_02615623 [Schizophyllum commune H4-8]
MNDVVCRRVLTVDGSPEGEEVDQIAVEGPQAEHCEAVEHYEMVDADADAEAEHDAEADAVGELTEYGADADAIGEPADYEADDEVDVMLGEEVDQFENKTSQKRTFVDVYRPPQPDRRGSAHEHYSSSPELPLYDSLRRGRGSTHGVAKSTRSKRAAPQPKHRRSPSPPPYSAPKRARRDNYPPLRLAPDDAPAPIPSSSSGPRRHTASGIPLPPSDDEDEDAPHAPYRPPPRAIYQRARPDDEYVPDADPYGPESEDDYDERRSRTHRRASASPSKPSTSSRAPTSGQKRKRAQSPSPSPEKPLKRKRHSAKNGHTRNKIYSNAQIDEHIKHMKSREGSDFSCTLCQRILKRKPELWRHADTHRGKSPRWACLGVPVAMRDKVPASLREYGPPEDRRVGGCLKLFSRKDSLQRHLRLVQAYVPHERCYGDHAHLGVDDDKWDMWLPFLQGTEVPAQSP